MQNSPLVLVGIALLTLVSFTSGWWIGRTTSADIDHEARLARLEQKVAGVGAAPVRAPAPAAAPAAARPAQAAAPAADEVRVVDVDGAPSIGPEDAAVTIVEFSDFECPFCSRVTPTLEQLRESYPDDVRLVFKHFPLSFHKHAMGAHKASIAAGEQGRFWEMHDRIFANRDKIDPDSLRGYAEEIGLDMAQYDAALESAEIEKRIQSDQAQGERLGVRGTPTFFINGRFVSGAKPYAEFEQRVKEELEERG